MINSNSCKRCLYSTNHPLGLVLDDECICSGCRIHEEKDRLPWNDRWLKLEKLVNSYRSNITYDCIVPVSGACDSYYILYIVREKLKLNPLLVTYNKYWNTHLGINNLANLRIKFNCDILIQNINPISVKRIVKTTFRRFGSIYWHCIAGQTVFPVQIAVRYKIPLIIWGAHQGMEQVGMFSHEHEVEMTRRYRKDHDLMGIEANDLLSDFDILTEGDIWQYHYPEDSELHSVGVRGIYLNNYLRWDPKAQHELMIKIYKYKTASFSRTFDTYDFVDCYNYMNIHDLLKMYKCGYSKVTDHACREIRHGRLMREDAMELVALYQKNPVQYVGLLCNWLGIDNKSLSFVLDLHKNKDIWDKDNQNKLSIRDNVRKLDTNMIIFKSNSNLNLGKSDSYVTIGKGWSL